MAMYDIYTPCDECPQPHQVVENIGNSYAVVDQVQLEITNALAAQIALITQEVAALVKSARAPIRVRMNTNNNTLGTVIDDVLALIGTANAENRAVLNQILGELQLIEQEQAAASDTTTGTSEAPATPVLAAASTVSVASSSVSSPHAMPPIPLDPCGGQSAADAIGAIAQWALQAVYVDSAGKTQIDQAGMYAKISVWLQQVAACPKATPEETAAAEAIKVKQSVTTPTIPEVPVDLDQPLAFRFAPDDSPWKSQAEAFYGQFLSKWDSAASLADLFAARDAMPSQAQQSQGGQ